MTDFYPRPPRGGRPASVGHAVAVSRFLSTPSARRATWHRRRREKAKQISIHALREEGDQSSEHQSHNRADFYPRPPRGGRQHSGTRRPSLKAISIHALREEGDWYNADNKGGIDIFLSTPSARRATPGAALITMPPAHFYPRPPRGGRRAAQATHGARSRNFYPRPPRGGRQQKQRQNLYFQTNYTTFCTNLEEP